MELHLTITEDTVGTDSLYKFISNECSKSESKIDSVKLFIERGKETILIQDYPKILENLETYERRKGLSRESVRN